MNDKGNDNFENKNTNKKRGRPLGYKLSEDSKLAISRAKKGQFHKEETKEKISKSLTEHFRKKNPVSEELINRYCRSSDDRLCSWFVSSSSDIDATKHLVTEKVIRNKSKIEYNMSNMIEVFSHAITPELILLFKEYCFENNLDPEDVMGEI